MWYSTTVVTSPGKPPRTQRSRIRRLLFAAVLLLLLYLGLETLSFAAFWITQRQMFSFAGIRKTQSELARLSSVAEQNRAREDPENFNKAICLHPYLGYVNNRDFNTPMFTAWAGFPINSFGFMDDKGPLRQKAENKVIIGILGGSVAQVFSAEGTTVLETELRQHHAFARKKIEFVNLGVGGYKQPQQALVLSYLMTLGAEFDMILNIDGFNEIALAPTLHATQGIASVFPMNWRAIAGRESDQTVRRLAGKLVALTDWRSSLAAWMQASPARLSVTCNLLWKVADDALAREIEQDKVRLTQYRPELKDFHLTGPVELDPEGDKLPAHLVSVWKQGSRLLHGICTLHAARYYHFLQPNQYVPGSKPLSRDEIQNAYDPESVYRRHVETGYALMRQAGNELVQGGVAFHDTIMVFANTKETVYSDKYCHLNALGNRVLADAIAKRILADFENVPVLPEPTFLELWADPCRLTLSQPLEEAQLRILGKSGPGKVHDLTYSKVTFSSDHPAVARVDGYGSLLAVGAGEATITARRGAHQIEIPVAVRFEPVVLLGKGRSPRPGAVPSLEAEVTAGRRIVLTVRSAGAAAVGSLCASKTPTRAPLCGGQAFVPAQSDLVIPVEAGAECVRLEYQLPEQGLHGTVYLQVFWPEAGDACGWSSTNALALTID